ncbi:MAG: hypothetical protein EBQ99_02020 [Planctomycetes bacterium]|nr:hypothetical protein [Planctomycetota bacterium]
MRRVLLAAVTLVCGLASCEDAAQTQTAAPAPPSGRRTSTYGKAMDRAEDLQKEVAEYNRQIERTIEQGTAPETPGPGAPKQP